MTENAFPPMSFFPCSSHQRVGLPLVLNTLHDPLVLGGCSSSWFDRVLDITRWDRHQTTERHSTIPFTPAFLPFHRLIEQGHLVHGVGNQHLWACVSLRGAYLKEQLPFM